MLHNFKKNEAVVNLIISLKYIKKKIKKIRNNNNVKI